MPVRDDRKHRDLHLEKKHVYNVYDQIAPKFSEISQKAWPNVRRFLKDLPPGSLVADIGCGSGRYLHVNNKVSKIGVDICLPLVESARKKGHEVLLADNLTLPFRDGIFDAVISIGVIHHFSSQSRRLQAVKEMCRLLRPGGQIMIYVWAFEQKHRKFKAQDVLIPWHGNHNNKRSGSLDLSSNASSDSESSLDTADSRKSTGNLNRTLSDPGTEHDDGQLQSYLRMVSQRSRFTQKHRCNTLPSSLEGLTGEDADQDPMPGVLAAECRKFEASLKAMSSSMFYLTENEQRQTCQYGSTNLNRDEKSAFYVSQSSQSTTGEGPALDNCFPPVRKQKTAHTTELSTYTENQNKPFTDDNRLSNGYKIRESKERNHIETKEICSTSQTSPVIQENSTNKFNMNCDICPEHKPSFRQYFCVGNDLEVKPNTVSDDGVKTKKNKLTLFASIKESFLNFFEGKSSKIKKPKLEVPLCSGEDFDVSDFAVREFPMSSCPNYRKELVSEDSQEVFLSSETQNAEINYLKDKVSDPDRHQTTSRHLGHNGALLKHSLSDISTSSLQSLKCLDPLSADSLRLRSQVNGMSRRHSHSLPTVTHISEPVQLANPPASVPSSPAITNEFFKSSTELSRFYHVFKDGELSKLISKHVPNVRIISTTYDHANWCIVAEKCH